MSVIAKKLVGFLFNGTNLTLASASWKPNVNAIYGFNPAGDGYQVFKPASNFNSLTQLKQDGSYIVDAKTLGFELPGATLTATTATANPLHLDSFTVKYSQSSVTDAIIDTGLASSDAGDVNAVLTLFQEGNFITAQQMSSPNAASTHAVSLARNTAYRAAMVTNLGHVLVHDFTTP